MAKEKKENQKHKNMRLHKEEVAAFTNEDFMTFFEQLKKNDIDLNIRLKNMEKILEAFVVYKDGEEDTIKSIYEVFNKRNLNIKVSYGRDYDSLQKA